MSFIKNSLQDQSEIYYERADIYERFSAAEDADQKVFHWLLPHIQGKTILDLGCGTGKYLRLFAPYAHHITGLDAAEAQLDIARDTLSGADNVTLVHGDAAQTALPVPAYDVIIACWMLGTVTGEQKRLDIINRMKSCLKPGGRMMLVENDSSGEFEEIRGKIPVSSAYNQWLQDKAGFSVAERLESCFRFENADDARAVIGAIWGEQVGQKVAGQFIKHNILIFDYSF